MLCDAKHIGHVTFHTGGDELCVSKTLGFEIFGIEIRLRKKIKIVLRISSGK